MFKSFRKTFKKGLNCTIVDARFAKPLDEKLIIEIATNHEALITIEEDQLAGLDRTLCNYYLIEVYLTLV